MQRETRGLPALGATAVLILTLATMPWVTACTRAVYIGTQDTIITVRSMDWMEDIGSNLWAFPRGMARDGGAGPNSIKWTSQYGSVVTSVYDAGTADGMNDQGLVANVLYLAESDYGKPDGQRPLISIGAWAQYVLDQFATVDQAVTALSKEPFQIVAPKLPNGAGATGHLALSDATGDSAVFEYLGGKLVIHHGRQYQVMTNSPSFDQQLALNAYWEQIGGTTFLPGTNRAADRFARASFYVKALPQTADAHEAIAGGFSLIRSVSVPLGIKTPGQPNIASTLWRVAADHRNQVYYFDSATSPEVFWVPIKELELKQGAPVKKLTLVGGKVYGGDAAGKFEPAKPFDFLHTAAE